MPQKKTTTTEGYAASRPVVDEAVVEHAALVKRIACHLKARLPDSVQLDDLVQAGMIGLIEACRHYDASQGARFETYAGIRIRGAMLDELRRNDWAPKSVHRKARELAGAVHTIEQRTGRDARDQEVAEELGITLDDYHRILQDCHSCIVSMEQYALDADDFLPTSGAGQDDPLQLLQHANFRAHLAKTIASLPERERIVISLYYESDLNLREIGNIIGVTESRISQLLNQGHVRLQARMADWRSR